MFGIGDDCDKPDACATALTVAVQSSKMFRMVSMISSFANIADVSSLRLGSGIRSLRLFGLRNSDSDRSEAALAAIRARFARFAFAHINFRHSPMGIVLAFTLSAPAKKDKRYFWRYF